MNGVSQVVSVTKSVLSFFVSASALLHFSLRNSFPPLVHVVWVLLIAMTGGFTGRKLGVWITWHYNRPSIIIFVLVCVLTCGICMLGYDVVTQATDFSWEPFC